MKIIRLETVDSTNTYALQHFEELDDLSAICANSQTKGKGRFDRVWISDCTENIYLSIVLKPNKKTYIANLTQYLCVVVAKTIEKYGIEPQIKWPNDVLINSKKICGILCESFLKNNKIEGLVLGVGINLNMPEHSLKVINQPATALNIETGKNINKEEFLKKLLEEFFVNYSNTIENGFTTFKNDYINRACFLGKTVFLQHREQSIREELFAKDIDNNGNLIAIKKTGEEKTILSGDIIL